MFTEKNIKIRANSYKIQVPGFSLQRLISKVTKDEFLNIADKNYKEMHGKYWSGVAHGPRGCLTPWEIIKHNRWSSINQRCINGCYSRGLKTRQTPQKKSYLKKGITLDMTKEQFFNWMDENKYIYDLIASCGDRPTIDRKDASKGYSLDNIQLLDLHSNIERRYGKKCRYQPESEKAKSKIVNARAYRLATAA